MIFHNRFLTKPPKQTPPRQRTLLETQLLQVGAQEAVALLALLRAAHRHAVLAVHLLDRLARLLGLLKVDEAEAARLLLLVAREVERGDGAERGEHLLELLLKGDGTKTKAH